MGSATHIYTLYETLGDERLAHRFVLVRVSRRTFSNTNQQSYDSALTHAIADRLAVLSRLVLDENQLRLVGRMEEIPIGNALHEARNGDELVIWFADTRFGPPWIVLGTAATEQAFMDEVAADEDGKDWQASHPRSVRVILAE